MGNGRRATVIRVVDVVVDALNPDRFGSIPGRLGEAQRFGGRECHGGVDAVQPGRGRRAGGQCYGDRVRRLAIEHHGVGSRVGSVFFNGEGGFGDGHAGRVVVGYVGGYAADAGQMGVGVSAAIPRRCNCVRDSGGTAVAGVVDVVVLTLDRDGLGAVPVGRGK